MANMNLKQLWINCLTEIEMNISKANFTTWFKNTEKKIDPNLVQNPYNFAGGRDVIGAVINSNRLLPADVNNLKRITAQVKNGSLKLAGHINKDILTSALDAGLRGQELNAQQKRAMIDFQEQFH